MDLLAVDRAAQLLEPVGDAAACGGLAACERRRDLAVGEVGGEAQRDRLAAGIAERRDPGPDVTVEIAEPSPLGSATGSGRSPRGSGRRTRARWWSIALRRAIVITQARGWAPSMRS